MSEEVQEKQETPAPEEEKKTDETAAEAQPAEAQDSSESGGEAQSADAKSKKINRFTIDELNAKIGEMENNKLTGSKYYKHLLQRKSELEKTT